MILQLNQHITPNEQPLNLYLEVSNYIVVCLWSFESKAQIATLQLRPYRVESLCPRARNWDPLRAQATIGTPARPKSPSFRHDVLRSGFSASLVPQRVRKSFKLSR